MHDTDSTPETSAVADPAEKQESVRPPRSSMFDDRAVRTMAYVAAGLVIFYLAVIVSALYLGVIGDRAPKTAAERDLMISRAKVEAGSQSERDWAVYAQALADAGQYARAQTVIDQATGAGYLDPRARHLSLAQTRLSFAQRDWEGAVQAADTGMDALRKQREDDLEKLLSGGAPTSLTATGLGDNYYRMLLIKATALEELGRDDEVLKALDEYLAQRATAADILEWRGDVHARLGDTEPAAEDYRAARRFTPDTAELDRKLEELGVSE
jgi:tetratricopeptide (TPR) repeat protein